MSRVLILLARFALSAWVGAATLFVVNAVRQVTFPAFDTPTRNQLALLRFPPYYAFGFVLVGLGCVALGVLTLVGCPPRRRLQVGLALSGASLMMMGVDYLWVYLPLEAMVTPPDRAVPAEFTALHHTSEAINTLHVGLALAAALVVCWPTPSPAVSAEAGANSPGA
jgi:hypothetical protein